MILKVHVFLKIPDASAYNAYNVNDYVDEARVRGHVSFIKSCAAVEQDKILL